MNYLTGALGWISSHLALIGGVVAVITTFLITRKFYVATLSNEALNAEIARRDAVQKAKARIDKAAHDCENKLPEDKPSDPPSDIMPPTITVCLALAFLWLGACASTPAIVTPELPLLKQYHAEHTPVTYSHKGAEYCTPDSSFKNIIHNEAEYRRVIGDYTTQIDDYNEFLKTYYIPQP